MVDVLSGGAPDPPDRRPVSRRWWALVGVALVAALGVVAVRGSDSPPSAAPPSAPPTPPSSAARARVDEPFRATAAAYTANQGAALVLGSACRRDGCAVLSRRTGPNGTAWEPPVTVARLDAGGRERLATRLVLDGALGLAYGPALHATRDGGRTWSEVVASGEVVDVSVVGRDAWLLLVDCGDQFGCRSSLAALDMDTLAVRPLPVQPLSSGRARTLVRVSAARAYVLADQLGSASSTPYLATTADGGATWNRPALPDCGQPSLRLLDASAAGVWLTCSDELHRSGDGNSWRYVGQLPARSDVLVVASSDVAYAWARLTGLFATSDGGRTWTSIADSSRAAGPPTLVGDRYTVAATDRDGTTRVTEGTPAGVTYRTGFGP